MASYQRNILVGALVLGAGVVFCWMILKFSSKTAELFAPPQMPLHFVTSRANGLSQGSAVQYLGVEVGRVTALRRNPDEMSVTIDADVDQKPPLPANVRAQITQTSAIGGAAVISLDVDGEIARGALKANQTINAKYVGLDLFPASLSQTADQINGMAEEIRKTAMDLRESGAIEDLDKTIKTVNMQASKVGQVFDSLQSVLGNPQTRDDLKVAIANIRSTTDKLNALADGIQKTTGAASDAFKDARLRIDDLSKQVGDRLTQVAGLLVSVQSIAEKIDKGQGTAGQLVNDPKLYQALVDTSRELNATVADLKRLIEQWEQEGVSIH
ncbi:MAG TPA: MlaD family protein [Tepidisphaeraceae bacterium]|jgi:phospholipid/cholesterol/gamma-HCH transport system substrate-binding protein|nr:MlaD family protein [Tepidisphaeraceae bacterium]